MEAAVAPEPAADVRLEGVTKRFDDVVAVDDVSLEIERGSFFALLGPSGCGKTTTLRMLGGFEVPDAGRILLGDADVTGLPPYRRDVNTVFQSYALFPHLTVIQNVAYGLKQRGLRKQARETRAHELLRLVKLEHLATRKPRQLSGGQQQRVALARALVLEPKVLLLDEPLGALDLKVRKQLQIELKRIQSEIGITFVYVTHDQEEALAMSDRVAVMNHGRIEQLGRPMEIYDSPATTFVADFIGETNFIRRNGAVVAVRPEQLELLREGGGDGLAGEIVTTMVVGPAIQSLVRIDDGQEVLVRQQRTMANGTGSPVEGDRVVVTWAEGAALVLDDGGGSNE
jgi:ABC-type Fe3+/spermidine/putrescine transport system ATPase subunit